MKTIQEYHGKIANGRSNSMIQPLFQAEFFIERIKSAARRAQFELVPYGMVEKISLLILHRPARTPSDTGSSPWSFTSTCITP